MAQHWTTNTPSADPFDAASNFFRGAPDVASIFLRDFLGGTPQFPMGPSPAFPFDASGSQGAPGAPPFGAPAPTHDSVPPASRSAISRLPDVSVTKDDLADEANSTCCICIDDFEIHERVTRLPCGHLFHRCCVEDWLQKHCTCPVCRYELPTSDPGFEQGRQDRMQQQRPRYRKRALERKSAHELKRLASAVGADTRGCLEKSDLVARLVESDRIEIIEETPAASTHEAQASEAGPSAPFADAEQFSPPEPTSYPASDAAADAAGVHCAVSSTASTYSTSFTASTASTASTTSTASTATDAHGHVESFKTELGKLSVSDLKQLMRSMGGLSLESCFEKAEMVEQILNAGTMQDHTRHSPGEARTSSTAPQGPGMVSLDELNHMPIRELKSMMRRLDVDFTSCIEKAEMVRRLLASGKVALC